MPDAVARERIERAASILLHRPSLIIYAGSRGEDLTTARMGLLQSMKEALPSEQPASMPAQQSTFSMDGDSDLSDMSE